MWCHLDHFLNTVHRYFRIGIYTKTLNHSLGDNLVLDWGMGFEYCPIEYVNIISNTVVGQNGQNGGGYTFIE